ncbi:MAG TPA: uracil-DNA glycosylase [Oscillospiraceae bacterium]|nr:uracil-DNA glycosylase [Oscillospiraceae bacterium]HPS34795.1 uracil-DNA glycosylase [Oscillospiraceae bacterium]
MDFIPQILPEDKAPPEAADCRKCELFRQRNRVIWGEGNPKAQIIVILDNPGAREDKEGREFICGTRQTLQIGASRAGLNMDELYVTYVLKCRPVRKYCKEEARGICFDYLIRQISEQKPKLAFCMGNTAAQWFFQDKDAEIKNLRGIWHIKKGLLTAVTYHPFAVRRRPNLFNQYLQDWEMLADRYFSLSI